MPIWRRGTALSLDYLPKLDLLPALTEASMFVQVISNLMANAIDYTPSGGVVTFSTGVRSGDRQEWITITVQDTGPGISTPIGHKSSNGSIEAKQGVNPVHPAPGRGYRFVGR